MTATATPTTGHPPGDAKRTGSILPYRVHVRDLAIAKGWKFVQTTSAMDTFTKGDVTVQVAYGSTQVREAHKLKGANLVSKTGNANRLQTVWGWLEQGKPYPGAKKFALKADALEALRARVGEVKTIATASA